MTKLPPDVASSSSCESAGLAGSPANTLPRTSKKRLTFDAPTSMTSSQTSQTSTSAAQAAGGTTTTTTTTAAPNRSFIRLCQKARRVRFFRNGDQYFKGVWYAISPERFRSFEVLLEDLTRSLVDLVNLPQGVRCLFTLDGATKVSDLDELKDGESYVCSSSDVFKRIDYLNAREPVWSYALPKTNGHLEAAALSLENSPATQESNEFVHPRLVTVIRSGVKPRRVVRLLLNKRTARTFRQVVGDITAMVKLDSGVVRKLFTLDGKQVTTLADFFADDDVFIAYGTERMSIDDFYLDSEEYKFLFSSRGKSARSGKSPRLARRLQGRLDGDQISGASPQLRRRFLHQRNQAIIRSLPRSARERNAENSEQPSTIGSSTGTPRASTPDLPSASIVAAASHPFEIEDRFAIGRLIGDGNFAIVHECICKKTKKALALKIISKENCMGKEDLVENEVAVLRRIDHEHIVKLYDVWDLEHAYYLSMELIPGGDLFDALCSVRQYDEKDAAHLMQSLMSALDYLHQISIVHRDVKPENLLMYEGNDGRKLLKLADFGLATKSDEMLYVVCGTPTYVAPEILAELGYGAKVDVWAAGIILYVMLCGFPPFQSMQGSQEELFEQILRARYKFPSPCWDHVSAAAKGLIQGMLQLDVDDRYSAEEVLIHPWITGAAHVDPEYEELAAIAVQSQLRSNADPDEEPMCSYLGDDDNVEYYYSRRRSMDDLSVPASQHEEDSDGDGDVSFEYLENVHNAVDESVARTAQ